jgi:hypothetical protein
VPRVKFGTLPGPARIVLTLCSCRLYFNDRVFGEEPLNAIGQFPAYVV